MLKGGGGAYANKRNGRGDQGGRLAAALISSDQSGSQSTTHLGRDVVGRADELLEALARLEERACLG